MLPDEIALAAGKLIASMQGGTGSVIRSRPLSGGDINEAFRLETGSGSFFLKYNLRDMYPGMFEAEARGLDLLHGTGEITVPAVTGVGTAGKWSFLILEYLESASQAGDFWTDFGTSLARMHRHTDDMFGLDHDNYIGSLPQFNHRHQSWADFFAEERLLPQMKRARDGGLMGSKAVSALERLCKKLGEIFPAEPPALVHGDLWSGNFMSGSRGEACLIDPAVYYGHREMDIGMSKLFGGFSGAFYEAYHSEYPLEPGWQERVDICNLYPLLVHVNLFGMGYVGSVERTLYRF